MPGILGLELAAIQASLTDRGIGKVEHVSMSFPQDREVLEFALAQMDDDRPVQGFEFRDRDLGARGFKSQDQRDEGEIIE